jgi:chemotaxis protein methyltransferase CheR
VRSVGSDETRLHLRDVYQRVMAIAAVQQHLHTSARFDHIEIGPYLTSLCESLAESMIGDSRSISLLVRVNGGTAEYATAVSLGLIATELVINALKYAFPRERPSGQVFVDYHFDVLDWKLTVSDNGIGKAEGQIADGKGGLGTTLVKALAQQLDAEVEVLSGPEGVVVSLTHANPDLSASTLAAGA